MKVDEEPREVIRDDADDRVSAGTAFPRKSSLLMMIRKVPRKTRKHRRGGARK